MTPAPPSVVVRRDRAAGVLVASAAADALGAPHEFQLALAAGRPLAMTGGGGFGWEPGEWTDDTQQAAAVVTALAAGDHDDAVDAIEAGLLAWYLAGPADVGNQTREILGSARREGVSLTDAAAAYQARNPTNAGNGSLMRTGPVGLAHAGDLDAIAGLARSVSALTHPHPDATDACVLWSLAIARAIDLPTDNPPDWIALVGLGLDHVDAGRRDLWDARLDACTSTPPHEFPSNGWVVTALQAALAAIVQTSTSAEGPPGTHLQLGIERAVRVGGDTDTVAAIAGALLGAYWGATAVPFHWRRPLHGRITEVAPVLQLADLDHCARLAANAGRPDGAGWPGVPSLLPHYRQQWAAPSLKGELVDGVVIGNVHALPDLLPRVDAVISLCRMGDADVPDGTEHHVIGLLDTDAADNPNLDLVLADTADLVAALVAERKRVFVHCVQAQNRTPAVAAAYLVRHHGLTADAALARAATVTGTRPRQFLTDAIHRIVPAM